MLSFDSFRVSLRSRPERMTTYWTGSSTRRSIGRAITVGRARQRRKRTFVVRNLWIPNNAYEQGSYREPKVLNVLKFCDFIRVPLNVLEFVLNVLRCSWIMSLKTDKKVSRIFARVCERTKMNIVKNLKAFSCRKMFSKRCRILAKMFSNFVLCFCMNFEPSIRCLQVTTAVLSCC